MIEIKNVSKKYGSKKALDNVSFNIENGNIFAFIGHNGAGKTTMFNIITGAYEPSSGEIKFDGKRLNGIKPNKIEFSNTSMTRHSQGCTRRGQLRARGNRGSQGQRLRGYHHS